MLHAFLLAAQTQALDAILTDPKLDGASVAAVVTDLDGRILYAHNPGLHVMPASNMKLFSNAFALYELGPSWRPETRIWKEPTRTVVDSTGDPLLTYGQLTQVRSQLLLEPNLPVYVREAYAPGWRDNWEYGDLPNKFAAPVCAFTVDRGSFEIWAKHGRPDFRPYAYGTKIVETVLPAGTLTVYDPFRRTLFADKSAFRKDGLVDTLSLPRPDDAAAQVLGSRLIVSDDLPSRPPDVVLKGTPVGEVVKACLPPSENQLAEQLLMLGARREGSLGPDEYRTALHRITDFLVRVVGVDAGELRIDDGSGLSRHNYVTARAITQLLAWENRQPTAELWRGALAHAGTGTLAHRLNGLTFAGKTGSLDMVVALSGYLETAEHQTRIVSIVLNEFGCSESEARAIADKFVRAVSHA